MIKNNIKHQLFLLILTYYYNKKYQYRRKL